MPRAATKSSSNSTSVKQRAQDAAAADMEHENAKAALAFRKQVAAHIASNADRDIINRYAVTDGKEQTLFELSKRKTDGKVFFYESYGAVQNFPRSNRLKRAGNPLDREDEDEEAVAVAEADALGDERDRFAHHEAAEWDREEARRAEAMGAARQQAREERARARAATNKKQKKRPSDAASEAAPAVVETEVATPAVERRVRDGSAEPTRRSSRVADARRRSSGQGAATGTIREDEEEHHVGNYSAGLARGQDDLASLLNGLQGCEIKSEAGTEITRIFERDDSVLSIPAIPVASTSRAVMV